MRTQGNTQGTLAGGMLRTALNATGVGALFDDGSDWLTLVNSRGARLLGLRQQGCGDTVSRQQFAWAFEDSAGIIVWSARCKEARHVPSEPARFSTRSGRKLEVRLSPLDRGEGWVWTIADVTRQCEHDATLEAARVEAEAARAQAEAASRAKSDFLATLSHEVRTPMNAIIGMTDLVLDSELNGDQRSLLRTVQTSAASLVDIVNDVLDLSKIESGTFAVREELFSIHDVVEGVANGLAPRAFEKGLELSTEVAPEVPRALEGDGHRLRQILVNLLGNAVKFTESGSVSLRCGVIGQSPDDVTLLISVRDTGVGIDEKDLDRIFEPFYQVDAPSKSRRPGTGLGLGITRRLADLMGGTVAARSEAHSGSVFHVTLPFRHSAKALPSRRSSDQPHPDVHILVVSPDTLIRRGALNTAAQLGTHRVMARTVEQAERLVDVCGLDEHLTVLADHQLGRPGLERLAAAVEMAAASGRSISLAVLAPPGTAGQWQLESESTTICVSKPLTRRGLASALLEGGYVGVPTVEAVATEPDRRGLRALLVEDHPAGLDFMKRVLEAEGMRVETAQDGSCGVEMYREGAYDIVITDLEMPGLDGFGVLDTIRQIEAETGRMRVPIVAATAHEVQGSAERCRATGLDGYLTKPIARDQLLAAVDKLVQPGPVVLVVDDDEAARELLRRILDREGYRIESAATGTEALRRVELGGISTVLLDWRLPDMEGEDVVRAIRALPGMCDLPVVAVTGHVGPDAELDCLAAGCDGYLSKPIRRETVLAGLSAVQGDEPLPVAELPEPAPSKDSQKPRARVPADIADLATIYLGDRLAEIGAFQDCVARRDANGIASLAHNIAGSASCFGFDALGSVARDLVSAVSKDEWERTHALVGQVWSYLSHLEWDVVAD